MNIKEQVWNEDGEIEAAKKAAKSEFSKFNIWLTLLSATGISATVLLSWQFLGYVNYSMNKEELDKVSLILTEHRERLESTTNELVASTTKKQQVNKLIDELLKEQKRLGDSIASLSKEEVQLKGSVKILKTQNDDLEKKQASYQKAKADWVVFEEGRGARDKERAEWDAWQRSAQETATRLNEQIAALQKDMEEKTAALSALAEQSVAKTQEKAALETEVNALKSKIIELETRESDLQKAKAEWDVFTGNKAVRDKEKADWEAQIKSTQESFGRLNARLLELNKVIEDKNTIISSLTAQTSAKTEEKAVLDAQVEPLKAQVAELTKTRDDLTRAQTEWEKFQADAPQRRSQMQEAQTALSELKKKHEEAFAQYEKQRVALLAEIDALIKQKKDLQTQAAEIDSLKQQINDLKEQLKQTQPSPTAEN